MQILVMMNLKEGVSQENLAPYMKEEVKHTLEAYLNGSIRNFWMRSDDKLGAVFMLESNSVQEATKTMGELPFVVSGLTELEIIPLQPLKPLGSLIGKTM